MKPTQQITKIIQQVNQLVSKTDQLISETDHLYRTMYVYVGEMTEAQQQLIDYVLIKAYVYHCQRMLIIILDQFRELTNYEQLKEDYKNYYSVLVDGINKLDYYGLYLPSMHLDIKKNYYKMLTWDVIKDYTSNSAYQFLSKLSIYQNLQDFLV